MAPYSPKDPEEEQAWETLRESIREAAARGDTTFNISQNPVIVQLPEDIKMMKKSLKTLHADNNYALAKLPPSLGELTSLTWLNVSYNQLTSLPGEIGRLTHLQRLHCNNNLLTALPLEIWNLKQLEELQADTNKLKAIPTGVLEMSKLTKLYINNNPLIKPEDVTQNLEDIVPKPPPVGDCSLTRLRFTECFVHLSFHKLCDNPDVPVVHYLADVKSLDLMKTTLLEKYGVSS